MHHVIPVVSAPVLLSLAKATAEALPPLMRQATDEKIRLNDQALSNVVSILNASTSPVVAVAGVLSNALQNARREDDHSSLDYMRQLIIDLKDAGCEKEEIISLLPSILLQEAKIREERQRGWFELATTVVLSVAGVLVVALMTTPPPPPKRKSWW